MSELPDIDDEQAKVIDRRLRQGFAFLRDVLDNPSIVDEIPSGSTLAYRDVAIDQGEIRLTAFRTQGSSHWRVRVTGFSGEQGITPGTFLWTVQPLFLSATWDSAEAAFDAFEATLQRVAQAHYTLLAP
jgi:hypothetical protein